MWFSTSITTLSPSQTWIEGPGIILLTVRIPLSTPSASTHWQCDHTVLVAFGVQIWHALEEERRVGLENQLAGWHRQKNTISMAIKWLLPIMKLSVFVAIINT